MCSVIAVLPCSPLIAPAFLAGSVDNLPPIRDNACYCLRGQTRHSHRAPCQVMQIPLIHAMERRLARQVSEAMQYHSDMPINREDAPAGALFQHLRDNGFFHALQTVEDVSFTSTTKIQDIL